jgi:hypothetical protein
MAKTKTPALPSKLWVKQEEDCDTYYFIADRDRDALVEIEPAVIGEYELVNTQRVKLVPQAI